MNTPNKQAENKCYEQKFYEECDYKPFTETKHKCLRCRECTPTQYFFCKYFNIGKTQTLADVVKIIDELPCMGEMHGFRPKWINVEDFKAKLQSPQDNNLIRKRLESASQEEIREGSLHPVSEDNIQKAINSFKEKLKEFSKLRLYRSKSCQLLLRRLEKTAQEIK